MVLGSSGLLANALIGLFSILVLVFSAEIVVKKMKGLARYYGISEVVIAVTIVSIGTSLPEIALHLVGSFEILFSSTNLLTMIRADPLAFLLGSHLDVLATLLEQGLITENVAEVSHQTFQRTSGTVMGASIGSDVVQETVVLGIVIISSALMAGRKGFRFSRKFLIRNYAPMIGTTLITFVVALNWRGIYTFLTGGPLELTGTITRLDGILLVGSFVAYMYYLYTVREEDFKENEEKISSKNPLIDLFKALIAMIAVVVSAEIFLRVVEVAIAQTGLSGSMIGVATVGIVSALPEMSTAISGLRHNSAGLSLGTLVGSNVTNPLLAIGSGAIISSYGVPEPVILWDLPMEAFLAGVPVIYMLNREKTGKLVSKPLDKIGLNRWAEKTRNAENYVLSITGAVLLIILYFVYLYIRFKYFSHDF